VCYLWRKLSSLFPSRVGKEWGGLRTKNFLYTVST
jgi:hypothetical protein